MAWQRRAALILDDHLNGVVARLMALTNRSGVAKNFRLDFRIAQLIRLFHPH